MRIILMIVLVLMAHNALAAKSGQGTANEVLPQNARALAAACVSEGAQESLCTCYADFVAKNTSARELEALTILTDPAHRGSIESAFKALQKKGLSAGEIFGLAMRADALQDKAKATCEASAVEDVKAP